MRWTKISLAVLSILQTAVTAADAPASPAPQTATVRVADGFDCPVGREGSKRFYVARGFRPNGHVGEDWNGEGGGDTDLGEPVFCTAHGVVVFAQDYKMGWGNVIIVRHAYLEKGKVNHVDSLYGHLQSILVKVGQKVSRGQKIGTIGNNRGMYDAHLHFEMRKNLSMGMFRNSFPRDTSVYWVPSAFIAAHQSLEGGGRMAVVPINTFLAQPPPVIASTREYTPTVTFDRARTYSTPADGLTTGRDRSGAARPRTPIQRSTGFKIDRYGDMRGLESP